MRSELRALMVEDSEDDALLLVNELESGGYQVTHQRVDTADAMRRALDGERWSLIIADYSMPHFSALAALTVYQDTGLDLPFIIVSGAIGEETAVAMMKAGAHDYIMKDNLTRFLPAVERELRDAEARRARRFAEEALHKSEERYRFLYESQPTMYFTVDADGVVLSANPFGAERLGYSVAELIGRPVLDVFHDDDKTEVSEQLAACIRHPETVATWEFRKVRRNGEVIWVNEIARATRDDNNEPVVLIVCEDITERKRMSEELGQLREELEQKVEQRMPHKDAYGLSFRELTVLNLVAAGKSDKEIGEVLSLSPLTAHKHVANILDKMNAHSRSEASARAVREGLVS